MKTVLILSNHHLYTYKLRKEVIRGLLDEGYKVVVALPYGEMVEKLKEMGCEFIDVPLSRRGTNPFADFKLFLNYYKILRSLKPDVVLTYTLKPNLYGGLACRIRKTSYIPNVTGLGTAVENPGFLQKALLRLYKVSFKKANCVFFQNTENRDFLISHKIIKGKYEVLPGSGVNLEDYPLLEYPPDDKIQFLFVSRIMKEKGIDQYLEAASYIKKKYPNTVFNIVGFCEEEYEDELKKMQDLGVVQYHGVQEDMNKFYKLAHCTIHPTYYPEGMSNVLLESAASGRPIITTDRSGCREIVDDGVNGFLIEIKNSTDLIEKIKKYLKQSYKEKEQMGISGREKVEGEFNREFIVRTYVKQVNKSRGDRNGL